MKVQESAENYLEMILMLIRQKGYARSIDIATELGVTRPSVSVAMKRLRENDFITVDKNGLISLTESGSAIAHAMFERHTILSEFLIKLGVTAAIAHEDACKLEHDLSEQSFKAIRRHMDDLKKKSSE